MEHSMERSAERSSVAVERSVAVVDIRDRGRRFEAEKSKKDKMWTEITKDLVSEEAIKESGYEYEETEEFYYVMEYLRYVCFPMLFPYPSLAAYAARRTELY